MNFLVVEDDPVDAEALERLMPEDVVLSRVTTLKDAIRTVTESEFHLVLLDLGLPDSSGIETFTQLRDATESTPIVVLTGFDSNRLAMQAIKEGAQDYLVKGYLDSRSLKSLGFAVERDRLARELEQQKNERRELEAELRQQERQLAHLGRVTLMGEIVGEISHEVGQPLQAISNVVAALEVKSSSGDLTAEVVAGSLRLINEELEQTQGILRRLRTFIKDSDPEATEFDLNDLVIATSQFTAIESSKQNIEVVHVLTTDKTMVRADRVQIQQILVNLTRNAFEAIGDLEPDRRRVAIRTGKAQEMVFVEVEDSGHGLEIRSEELFTPFVTTKQDGLGMGLAICARIAKNHGGEITAESSTGKTLFRLKLPEQS